ncbi:hypothetical protein NDU88_001199 [Pleurodeles waltl]|uniref:Uncharacterized protein n=1 Tax=Pleurodeles waltl TaxID=8319 RepID=A0AAV7Q5B3_PLEWA|nr:hypothetical protein NDU88_001199 [Pleurodeles waltl]
MGQLLGKPSPVVGRICIRESPRMLRNTLPYSFPMEMDLINVDNHTSNELQRFCKERCRSVDRKAFKGDLEIAYKGVKRVQATTLDDDPE